MFLRTLIFCLFCTSAWSAELLVQAVDSPFETGGKKGDVIVVRGDGWKWGKEECLPRYIVVKMPGVLEEDAKKYEEQLTEPVEKVVDGKTEITQEMVRLRKYSVGASVVEGIKFTAKSDMTVASKDMATFVKTKDLATEKALIDAKTIK